MKKTFIYFSIFISFLFLTGCMDKQSLKSQLFISLPEELQQIYDQMPVRTYGTISVLNGNILSFQSVEQYNNVINQLAEDCRLWDSLFCLAYSNLSDEELLSLEEDLGYSEFLPIKMFEDQYGVSGLMLFDVQEGLTDIWMDNGCIGNSPTDNIFILESEQAVHTPYREVCVNDTLYQFRDSVLVLAPVSLLDSWLLNRNTDISELPESFIVKDDVYENSNIEEMPAFKKFTCEADDKLEFADFQAIGENDFSEWIVKGRRGLTISHVITYKLVNYEYVRTKNNGQKVYRKKRLPCSMMPSLALGSIKYTSSNVFLNWSENDGFLNQTLPGLKNVKCFSGRLTYQHTGVDYITYNYSFGVFTEDATVEIRIGIPASQTFDLEFE
ncbi:MAG: hypothetical protein IKU03_03480 [Bacteroidales bacterium]|nr:hypothetical protein [Bacteroidales bacterium]